MQMTPRTPQRHAPKTPRCHACSPSWRKQLSLRVCGMEAPLTRALARVAQSVVRCTARDLSVASHFDRGPRQMTPSSDGAMPLGRSPMALDCLAAVPTHAPARPSAHLMPKASCKGREVRSRSDARQDGHERVPVCMQVCVYVRATHVRGRAARCEYAQHSRPGHVWTHGPTSDTRRMARAEMTALRALVHVRKYVSTYVNWRRRAWGDGVRRPACCSSAEFIMPPSWGQLLARTVRK